MEKSLFLLAFALSVGYNSSAENVLTGRAVNQVVEGAEKVRIKDFSSIPAHIKFYEEQRIAFSSWQAWMSNNFFSEHPSVTFDLIGEESDKMGMTHFRYQQMVNGYPITNGIWIVHVLDGEVVSMNGDLFDNIPNFSPSLSESQALQNAISNINAELYKWEVEAEEALLKMEENDPNASYYPQGKLEIVNQDPSLSTVDLHLTWKFNVYAQVPLSRREVYVDATSGSIVFENDLIHHADSTGSANTGYSGTQTIITDYTGTNFRLRESGRGNGIETYSLNNGTSYGAATDIFDNDNNWTSTSVDIFGTDAYWGTEMTYDYFFNNFGRNSIDDNGFTLRSYVHYGVNYANAFWDGQRMTYGDGPGGNAPFTALDIAGHEVTHGLTNFTSNLIYQGESGALNESFSDIFGASVEFDALGFVNGDWLMGEDLGFIIRNMANPNSQGDPDTYLGANWASTAPGSFDNGGVHINSGVQNFWYYLLVVGATGTNDNGDNFSVNGIGLQDAGAIAFRNNTVYLTPSSQYVDARYYAIESALDLFGPCSPQVINTANAWHAVGIGDRFPDGVVADYGSNTVVSCVVPHTVQFANLSFNGASYLWDFGDGTTSTQFAPTHTYTTAGVYDVSLIVTSSCGADTLDQAAYIQVGPNGPCEFTIPSNGTVTETDCSGVLFDNGGPLSDYSNSTNSTFVIAPPNTGSISLEFVSFDLQNGGSTCTTDYLEVYDGPNTNSSLIGKYCGSNPPPSSISSQSGAVTLKFFTNGSVTEPGFRIDWDCNPIIEEPIADFSSNILETCNGFVSFFDQSLNGTTSWSWDFGDGGTSTAQNPTHYYTVNGTYEVTLIASNQFGSDTEVKTSYIVVDRPEAPVGNDAHICPGENAVLTASSQGFHRWYDVPFGGSYIQQGNNFTTPILQNTTSYYVESIVPGGSQNIGAPNNLIGSFDIAQFPNTTPLFFNAYNDFLLHSIRVYATTSGERTFVITNGSGQTVATRTVNVTQGNYREVVLDVNIIAGNGYRIFLSPSSSVFDLYYNTSGVDFPYEIPGLVSIYQSGGVNGLSEYYFFYDWEIQEYCISDRTEIQASTAICLGVDEIGQDVDFDLFPNPTNDQVTASWPKGLSVTELSTYNLKGQLVSQINVENNVFNTVIDCSELSQGVYLVELKTEKGSSQIKRLIVQ